MKKTILFILFLISGHLVSVQTIRYLTKKDIVGIAHKIKAGVQRLEDSLAKDKKGSDYLMELTREFAIDTFKME